MMQRTRDWIGACDWLKKFQGQVTANQRDVKDLSKATSHMTIQGNVIYIFFFGGGGGIVKRIPFARLNSRES